MAWPSSIPTFATGIGGITVTKMNQLRDALNTIGGGWTPYSSVLSSNTTPPTLGASTIGARYRLVGKTADVHVNLTLGAGFDPGVGAWTFTLPPGVSPLMTGASEALGAGITRHATFRAPIAVEFSTPTTVALILTSADVLVGPGLPWAWATGDRLSFFIPSLEVL